MGTLWAMLTWLVFGLVAGAIARLLVPGRQSMGLIATMVLGVIGSFAGGFLHSVFRGGDMLQPSGMLMSVVGAILVLVLALSMSTSRSPQ
jgi:uncharacterized membrane protein YeaQ/YmgE (transglycosylase-associated protein family)